MIPVVVSSGNNNYDYNFDVLIDSDRILDKGSVYNLNYNILQDKLENPNIKVSMYKKSELTAYNQDYDLIDMGNYSSDSLDSYIDSVNYLVDSFFPPYYW